MKKCTWCGKEYPDTALKCPIDEQPLVDPQNKVPAAATEEQQSPSPPVKRQWIDLNSIAGAFEVKEGFSRPNWKLISQVIEKGVPAENAAEAWDETSLQWADHIRADLGADYRVNSAGEFVLLSNLESAKADQLVSFANQTLDKINRWLKDAAWKWDHGKHVILLFAEEDDYYQYVSYFYNEGEHPTSGGCLIHKDYVHIAMPYADGCNIQRALAHELLHNCVVHLPLPLWLNEGLAVILDSLVSAWRHQILEGDLRERHLAFWNESNIQKFWAGVSFGEPGESNELSYSLAEVLVHLLFSEGKDLVAFLLQAQWEDGGQTAALDTLGVSLGDLAGTFLGPGDWRPRRKAMVECWQAQERSYRDGEEAESTCLQAGQDPAPDPEIGGGPSSTGGNGAVKPD